MGGRAGGILPLLAIAAAAAATIFSGGAAAPALAGVAEGVAGGGLAAGEVAAGASALGATEAAGLGAEAAMMGGEAAGIGAEAAGASEALAGGAEAATAANAGGGLAGAGAETVTAANSSAAAELKGLDAMMGAPATQSVPAVATPIPPQMTPVPAGFDPASALSSADSGVWSWVKSNKDMIGLGMSGVSAANSAATGHQQAQYQEGMLKVQQAQDALDMESRANEAQGRLSRALASQNNFFQARGVSGGSSLSLANAAESDADRAINSMYAMQQLSNTAARFGQARTDSQKAGAITGSLLDFGQNAADAFDLLPTRRRRLL